MKKACSFLYLMVIFLLSGSCGRNADSDVLQIILTNHSDFTLTEHTVDIDIDKNLLPGSEGKEGNLIARSGGKSFPVEYIESTSRLFLQVTIPANDSLIVDVSFSQQDSLPIIKKTLAELWYKTGGRFEGKEYKGGEFNPFKSLRVPDSCTDHSYYIKYEGPGWESDKVGYRLYLDWRNAIDIYGKKIPEMVLPGVGLDGYESYHEMSEWGMDVLKVGASLGIGSIGFWDGEKAIRVEETDSIRCEINADNNLQSEVQIDYYGWKINTRSIDLHTSLSIVAGSRATRYSMQLSDSLENLCTGIVKSEGTELIIGDKAKGWKYIATWGLQSLAGDSLGMAVFCPAENFSRLTEDENSHVMIMRPLKGKLEYYFLAAWEKESGGITTRDAFVEYVDEFAETLAKPVKVQIR